MSTTPIRPAHAYPHAPAHAPAHADAPNRPVEVAAPAGAPPRRGDGLGARRILLLLCFLIPCVLIELLVMYTCYHMLVQTTNPAVAVVAGLSIVAVVLMGVELLKIPFAVASAAAPGRIVRWICTGLFFVVSIGTAETIMTGVSKVYELSIEPAVRAEEQIDAAGSRIAAAEAEMGELAAGSEQVEALIEQRRDEATTELERLAAERAARFAELDRRAEEARATSGLEPLERERLASIDEAIAERRRAMTATGPGADRIDALDAEITALLAAGSEATSRLNVSLRAIGEREQADLVRLQEAARERRAAAGDDRDAELARLDAELAAASEERAAIVERRDAEIAEHRANDRAFYNLREKIQAAEERAEAALAEVDARIREVRAQRDRLRGAADPRAAVDAWLAAETGRVRAAAEAEREAARAEHRAAAETRTARREQLDAERARLTEAMAAEASRRNERLVAEIASLEAEAAGLREAASDRVAAARAEVDARLAAVAEDRRRVTEELDAAVAAVIADRDERIARLERRALSPEAAAARRDELAAVIAAARAEITEAGLVRDRSRKDSIVYQLARVVSKTDDPTDAEIQWTLKVLIPIAAFIVAIAPAAGVKLGLHSVLPPHEPAPAGRRRRRRAWGAVRETKRRLAEHESRRRMHAERQLSTVRADVDRLEDERDRHKRNAAEAQAEVVAIREDFREFLKSHPEVVTVELDRLGLSGRNGAG